MASKHNMNKNDLKNIICNIQLPFDNVLFEKESSDGYAFLGYARKYVDLDYNECLDKIIQYDFSIKINNSVEATATNKYIYQLWPCTEFLKIIHNDSFNQILLNTIDNIGTYKSGHFRYCIDEYHREIPNATSCASLLYCLYNQLQKAERLLYSMQKWQHDNGSWQFIFYPMYIKKHCHANTKKMKPRFEDSFHVSMIIYQLKTVMDIQKIKGNVMLDNMLHKALKYAINTLHVSRLKIDMKWEIPMLLVALSYLNINHVLIKTLEAQVIHTCINHKNFRTRAYAAWSLTTLDRLRGELCQ